MIEKILYVIYYLFIKIKLLMAVVSEIIFHRDDGNTIKLPVKIFFREESEMSNIEKKALELCYDEVLDIGAGTGIHSLILQRNG